MLFIPNMPYPALLFIVWYTEQPRGLENYILTSKQKKFATLNKQENVLVKTAYSETRLS